MTARDLTKVDLSAEDIHLILDALASHQDKVHAIAVTFGGRASYGSLRHMKELKQRLITARESCHANPDQAT